ncbi:hypothetical protein TNCV_5027441 [Trichonephila clavipes]|nr:hypothetical protein TNCV_5027441 [Trichonephila clavipes]
MGNLVVKESESRPEGLGSMPPNTFPSTYGVRFHEISGSESLVGDRNRCSKTIATDEGSRMFESKSSDENNTRAGTSSPNLHPTPW